MIEGVMQHKKMDFESTLSAIHLATEEVLKFFDTIHLNSSDRFDLRLCFEESLINAVKYGNCGKIHLKIKVEVAYSESEIFIAVEDEGKGFDPSKLPDPTKGEHLEMASGRGVYLIKHLMDKVKYSKKGSRIEMIKGLNRSNQKS